MLRILGYTAFLIWLLTGLAFSYNWYGCNQYIFSIDGGEKYSWGEFVYQMGVEVALMLLFLSVRWDVKGWINKLFCNWMVEIMLIVVCYTFRNPYTMNYDKVLFLHVSVSFMAILYLTCYLFPKLRKIII